MEEKKYKIIFQIMKFGIVGVTNTIIGYGY